LSDCFSHRMPYTLDISPVEYRHQVGLTLISRDLVDVLVSHLHWWNVPDLSLKTRRIIELSRPQLILLDWRTHCA